MKKLMSSLLIFLGLSLVITSCSEQPYYAGEQSALSNPPPNNQANQANNANVNIVTNFDNEFSLEAKTESSHVSISTTSKAQPSNSSANANNSNILNISESNGTLSFKAGNSSDSLAITAKGGDFSIQNVSQ